MVEYAEKQRDAPAVKMTPEQSRKQIAEAKRLPLDGGQRRL